MKLRILIAISAIAVVLVACLLLWFIWNMGFVNLCRIIFICTLLLFCIDGKRRLDRFH